MSMLTSVALHRAQAFITLALLRNDWHVIKPARSERDYALAGKGKKGFIVQFVATPTAKAIPSDEELAMPELDFLKLPRRLVQVVLSRRTGQVKLRLPLALAKELSYSPEDGFTVEVV